MAGVAGQKMKLIVGHREFTGLLSQMDLADSVAELDDSVAGTDDMEYIPGQLGRTLTVSGRWTGDADDIDAAIEDALLESGLVASSMDGEIYNLGTFTKTSKAVNASLGSRVNVSVGFRYAEADRVRAREVLRQDVDTSGATTTYTGPVIDLGASLASASHTFYVWYFEESGGNPQMTVRLRHSTTEGGTYNVARTHSFTASALTTAISDDEPLENAASYALNQYVQGEVVISGTGREGTLVFLVSDI